MTMSNMTPTTSNTTSNKAADNSAPSDAAADAVSITSQADASAAADAARDLSAAPSGIDQPAHQPAKRDMAQKSLFQELQLQFREEVFTNWRLVLLGVTGLVLSLSSDWTTYDGMTNFTRTPVLSLLITFGIQGVMLVTAWLIGESFAMGATGERSNDESNKGAVWELVQKALFLFVSVALLLGIAAFAYLAVHDFDPAPLRRVAERVTQELGTITAVLGGILGLAFLLVVFSKAEIIGAYARGARIILNHLPLWIMFLACMATSVFFSFDSLFSTIFPPEERQRAGELRAANDVSGMIADLTGRIQRARDEAVNQLLTGKDWRAYDKTLLDLTRIARKAPAAVEEKFIAELEKRQAVIMQQRAGLSKAQSERTALETERSQLQTTIKRAEQALVQLQADMQQLDAERQAKKRELTIARAAAEQEARGVGSSGRSGKGPKFRELQKQVIRLKIEFDAISSQLRDVTGKFNRTDKTVVDGRKRLAVVTQRLANVGAEAQSLQARIKAQETLGKTKMAPTLNAASGFRALEKELTRFRQLPTEKRLTSLQQLCGDLLTTLSSVEKLKAQTRDIDCDPGKVADVAARVFAANTVLAGFMKQCGDARKMPRDTDGLIQFGQTCILSSGLPSAVTRPYRRNLNSIALNRDDKAHRFVVTWNAVMDGNRLAYLAIAIAVAIDSLVFMSGLFGANVMSSPLSESPGARSRSVTQLQNIIDNALLPDKAYAAELTQNVMEPRHGLPPGYMAEINLGNLVDAQMLTVRNVLTAGSTLQLVRHKENAPYIYEIRSELYEYLSQVRAREMKLGRYAQQSPVPQYKVPPAALIQSQPADAAREAGDGKAADEQAAQLSDQTVTQTVSLADLADMEGLDASDHELVMGEDGPVKEPDGVQDILNRDWEKILQKASAEKSASAYDLPASAPASEHEAALMRTSSGRVLSDADVVTETRADAEEAHEDNIVPFHKPGTDLAVAPGHEPISEARDERAAATTDDGRGWQLIEPKPAGSSEPSLEAAANQKVQAYEEYKEDRELIEQSLLDAVGLEMPTQVLLQKLESLGLPNGEQQARTALERMASEDNNARQGFLIIESEKLSTLERIQARLKQRYQTNPHLLEYINTTTEDIMKLMPEILLWSAYQQVHAKARENMEILADFQKDPAYRDSPVMPRIEQIASEMEKAEQSRLSAFLELYRLSQESDSLARRLKEASDRV